MYGFHPRCVTGKWSDGNHTPAGWYIGASTQPNPTEANCLLLDSAPWGRFNSKAEVIRAIASLREAGITKDEQAFAIPDSQLRELFYRDLFW